MHAEVTALFVARLNESKLGVLPDSMLTSVFEYLHTTEFTPVMPVSREWARLSASDELWTAIGHAHKQDYVVCAGCDGSRTSKADQLRLKGLNMGPKPRLYWL